MRMSCNGCRVLRKGCSENCSIRPCLQWIKSPESQANATVFLAKFYGRAGLMNLINAGPEHLRPAIFRSLLYEACGRIVNPIYGSVGLMWSGSWPLCQAAVEAVLRGASITQINSETAANAQGPPLKAYDIRHVSKDENSAASNDANRVRTRCRVGRVVKPKASKPACGGNGLGSIVVDMSATRNGLTRSASHESSVSHQSELAMVDGESKETDESMMSVETAEDSLLFRSEPESKSDLATPDAASNEIAGLGLDLALGLEPVSRAHHVVPVKKRRIEAPGSSDFDTCKMELGLDYAA
ncbi:PREDICTED: LOB domain-containing protein 41 [Populus euphratica]|uniref:LOB domain-containing protein 41 n=1 Tax=Populus euphratica TaxID=75702 RepID=A0AAJ6UTF2_POPEU|nr:PREDICTED: LOB domain-containing protein 41 [Populus euphratica]